MYEDTVKWFAHRMMKKLDENRHKSGWTGCQMWWLRRRLLQEFGELERAIKAN